MYCAKNCDNSAELQAELTSEQQRLKLQIKMHVWENKTCCFLPLAYFTNLLVVCGCLSTPKIFLK